MHRVLQAFLALAALLAPLLIHLQPRNARRVPPEKCSRSLARIIALTALQAITVRMRVAVSARSVKLERHRTCLPNPLVTVAWLAATLPPQDYLFVWHVLPELQFLLRGNRHVYPVRLASFRPQMVLQRVKLVQQARCKKTVLR